MLTFEPHPRTVFKPDEPVFRLTHRDEKARLARALGLAGTIVIPFDRAFAAMSPERFVDEVLRKGFGARHVVTGFDFHFGAKRAGTPQFLKSQGDAKGFGVTVVEAHGDEGGAISSSRIREALEAGDLETAERLLGYRWFVSGEVIHGEKRGRTLGYPTANIALAPDCRLRHGIYAVRARVAGGMREGVASYGRRPTFDNGAELLETFLFDFAGELYGRQAIVQLVSFLRPELRFDTADDLVEQMDRDAASARRALTEAGQGTGLDHAVLEG